MKIDKQRIDLFLVAALAFFCMLDFNTVYSRFTTLDLYINEITILLCLGVPVFSILMNQKVNKKSVLFVLIYILYAITFVYFSPKVSIGGYIIKFILCLPMLVVYYSQDIKYSKNFLRYFSYFLYIIAMISLVFYFFTTIISVIKPLNTILVSWRGDAGFRNYFYLYFSADYSYFSHGILRNTGIFVEAPQYGMNLVFALMYELFVNNSTNYKRVIIFCITIFSTFSFGSILTMMIMLYLKLLFENNSHTLIGIINTIILIVLAVLGLIVGYALVLSKINTGNSFKIRVDDFISGFKSWKLHPLFGNGYNNSSVVKQFVGSFRSWSLRNNQIGFSNSIAMILSNGGVYLFLTYLISSILFLCSEMRKKKYLFAIVFTFFSMLFLNSFAYSMYVINFMAIEFSTYCLKNSLE